MFAFKNLIVTFVCLVLAPTVFAQDTTYFDKDLIETTVKDSAVTYMCYDKGGPSAGLVFHNIYSYPSNKIITVETVSINSFSDTTYAIRTGPFTEYYLSGKIKAKGNYLNDKLDGELTSFWPNGVLRRREYYQNGKLKSKEYYDSTGKKSKYVKYMQKAEFESGMHGFARFFQNNLSYPTNAYRNKVEGQVIVTFVIGEDGYVSKAKVVKGVAPELDAEALRIIHIMPKWSPAAKEGIPVKIRYTVPLRFDIR